MKITKDVAFWILLRKRRSFFINNLINSNTAETWKIGFDLALLQLALDF